jgi:hypothetical protein
MILTAACILAYASGNGAMQPADGRFAPRLMNYQGYLTDTLSNPITNPSVSMTFTIYDAASSGNLKWSEIQGSVGVDKGIFHVLLGGVNPIPDSVFKSGADHWLELTIGGQPLTPRTRIVSVPFAYTATFADTALYAINATSDNDWVRGTPDSVLYTANFVGIARGAAGNMLYGNYRQTHINFGEACTTGVNGQNLQYITIGGGYDNRATADWTTIGGGTYNLANGFRATIAGGSQNTATGYSATIGGGMNNVVIGWEGTVAGGRFNKARGHWSTIGGGGGGTDADSNSAIGDYSVIGGGHSNVARGLTSIVGGGYNNITNNEYAAVGGGYHNVVSNNFGSIAGGYDNIVTGWVASVAGGSTNTVSGYIATIGGGSENVASGECATIAGGSLNTASNTNAAVGGGRLNRARGMYSVISGGGGANEADSNSAMGDYSSILGGRGNKIAATGDYSYLFGINSNLTQDSTFMVDMPHVWFGTEANGYEFPYGRGTDGQVMKTNGSGILSWGSIAYVDSARIAANAYKLQGKDTTDLNNSYVNEGQVNSITNAMIQDAAVTMPKIAQAGALTGQVIKWNGTAWQPAADSSMDNDWSFLVTDGADTTLQMGGRWGLARPGNTMYGNADSTHVNLGVGSITGTNGQNYKYITIGGGYSNTASYNWTTVGGGDRNTAGLSYATVGGGVQNNAGGQCATVSGGSTNVATSECATVAGGNVNTASNYNATVSGGQGNIASGYIATVGGGKVNRARGAYSVVTGGGGANDADSNSAIGDYSAIGGGHRNIALGVSSVIDGGYVNTTSSSYATVGGGTGNLASGSYTSIGGGQSNTAGGTYATVGGGTGNNASNDLTTIAGGANNIASAGRASVGGGSFNTASGVQSTVGGGLQNIAADSLVFIGAGYRNYVAGKYSAILGGYADTILATGSYSYLFGINSNLTQDSTFMVDMPHVWFGTEANGYEFPYGRGSNGQVMVTNGSGLLSWSGITYVDSARVAANAHKLQGKDTVALDLRWVNEGQVNSITNAMIQDAAVTMPKIAQAGAIAGQVIKWNGTAWQPAADSSMDNDWSFRVTDGADTTLQMGGRWGIARAGNTLYGNTDSTHVNLGLSSVTGRSGEDNRFCTVSGGGYNTANRDRATVGGGWYNTAGNYEATVGGGSNNNAGGNQSTISGGAYNVATDDGGTIGGGYGNTAASGTGFYATVGGGQYNAAGGYMATIGGGENNTASGYMYATVGGGYRNTASGDRATVSGGMENLAAGAYSAILSGYADTIFATGNYSYLFGINSNLTQDSTFMVDMPHVWFGTEANGYEFPRSRGTNGQALVTNGSGQVGWASTNDNDWILSGSNMYSAVSGNVGIGTTTPAVKLDVSGTAQVTGFEMPTGATNGYILTSDASGFGTWQAIPGAPVSSVFGRTGAVVAASGDYTTTLVTEGTNLYFTNARAQAAITGGASTITTSNLTANRTLLSDGSGKVAVSTVTNTELGYLSGVTSAIQTQLSGKAPLLSPTFTGNVTMPGTGIWNASGNVGIGVASPAAKLDVAGTVKIADGTQALSRVFTSDADGLGSWQAIPNDNDWVRGTPDSVLYTANLLGIARGGAGNMLYGIFRSTHINFGVSCTTGTSGQDNQYCTIGGGSSNHAAGFWSTVAGGYYNTASGYAFVGGGYENRTNNTFTVVSGGYRNYAGGMYAMVGGGLCDTASGNYATIGGGIHNNASALFTFVGGGQYNTASNLNAVVGGGKYNKARGQYSVVSGGGTMNEADSNSAIGDNSAIGGGYHNIASGLTAVIGGGFNNTASYNGATVAGGQTNTASGDRATVGGGGNNTANNQFVTISGGIGNNASGNTATVVGGNTNTASGEYATVGAGVGNTASGNFTVVGGGWSNRASGNGSIVTGGYYNSNAGDWSAILGGNADTITAAGSYSYLFGINSNLTQDSTFMVDMPHIRFGTEAAGYEFPTTDGANGQVMKTNGAGQLSWGALADNDWTISGNNMYSAVSGNVGIGTASPAVRLNVVASTSDTAAIFRGNLVIQSKATGSAVLELGEGLDYAEGFDVNQPEKIKPGMVMVIDPASPGKLAVSSRAYDTKVAGIVAGGKGLGSGVRLGTGDFDYNVALAGRVYCNVDASNATVEPGDLLTTANTPGFAMKASDYDRAKGAVLGKAMERLERGQKGQILVLVSLQ